MLVDLQKTHIGPVAADDPIKALVYCAQGSDVDTVIIDGVTRVAHGELIDVDTDALRTGADQFNQRLLTSVGRATYQGRPLTEFYTHAYPDWEE